MLVRTIFKPAARTEENTKNGSAPRRHTLVPTGHASELADRTMVPYIEEHYDALLDRAKHDAASHDKNMPFLDALLEMMLRAARDGNKLTPRESVMWWGNVRHCLHHRFVNLDHVLVVLQFIREEYNELYKTEYYPKMLAHKYRNLSADKKCATGLSLAEQENLQSAAVKKILVLSVSPFHPGCSPTCG